MKKIKKYFSEIALFIRVLYKIYRTIKEIEKQRQTKSTGDWKDDRKT